MENVTFEEVLNQYLPLIKGQIKALNIYKDYENFYQIGMIALWEAYKNFSEEKGDFTPYALKYVRGRLLTALKKSAKYEEKHQLQESYVEDVFLENYLQKESLEVYLEQLTEKQKKWVIYYTLFQLTPKEIAKKEGVSVEAVKSWRKQAIKRLRKLIEEKNYLLVR